MGVKTLHPSDYALVSRVTKHFSGVQLLPTVYRYILGNLRFADYVSWWS